jgi:photosystem II stability/assembly factor-like uncharacterized protein
MTNKILISILVLLINLSGCKKNNPTETDKADTQAPTTSIIFPLSGSDVKADTTYTVIADASDNIKVTKVDFYISGQYAGSDSLTPYEYRWNTHGLTGSPTIMAKACDEAGNTDTTTAIIVNIHGSALSWIKLTPTSGYITSIVIDPITPSTIYAGGQGLFKSMNGGGSWSTITLPNNGYIARLSINQVNPSILYAVIFGTNGIGNGVYKSTDGGVNWSPANSGLPQINNYLQLSPITIDKVTPSILYVKSYYTSSSGGLIYKSTDSGNTWQAVATNVPFSYVSEFVVDQTTPSIVYACSTDGLFKSTDGGISWNKINIQNNLTVHSLTIDPATPTTLYAGTNGGPYKSTNNGATWVATPTQGMQTMAIVIDASKPGTMYASGTRGQLFRSTDYGNSWQWVSTIPDGMDTYELEIISASQTLYLITTSGTFFKLDL